MFDATTTPMQQMESNTRKLQQALVPLGEKLAELANAILPPLLSVITTIGGWFERLPGPVQNFVIILGALLAAFTALTPVSYTHLDVYKRQIHSRARHPHRVQK